MLARIKEILIISIPVVTPKFESLLGGGGQFRVSLHYRVQPSPDGLAQMFLVGRSLLVMIAALWFWEIIFSMGVGLERFCAPLWMMLGLACILVGKKAKENYENYINQLCR